MRILIVLAFLLSGCATPYYQRANEDGIHRTGYSEKRLTDTSYRIIYLDVKSEEAYTKFLMRSSQLTIENGFTHFTIKDAGANKENAQMMAIYGGAFDMALPQYEATVMLWKGTVPDSFSAAEILKHNPIPTPRKPANRSK
jgi:hypothetical protein